MTAELKALWVAALESGEYAKGKDVLRSGNETYCCLGVLCDIAEPEKWREPWSGLKFAKPGTGCKAHEDNTDVSFPSQRFLHRVGLSGGIASRLADKNDKTNTFDEVIEMIKELVEIDD